MAKGRRKVQPRGVGLLFRCKRRNRSRITAGVGWRFCCAVRCKMATTTTTTTTGSEGKRDYLEGKGREGNVDVADGFIIIIIETIDAGLLVLYVRQGKGKGKGTRKGKGNRTSSHAHADGAPSIVFVPGRIWGFEDYLLERMTLEPLLAD
jgi:hypothetical protein